ncbi:MAG: hypothetical protein KIT73_20280, partial [Burkholderiales bacterium]|nr:hypothetical protein [Burkholderiales bacterium]
MNVQRLPFLQGWYWIVGGWKLFLRKPLTWIVFTLILWFIVQLSGVHWLLASAVAVFLPVFIAGWARACEAAERGESVPVPMLFEGFRRRFGELSAVGGFNAIGNILVLLVVIAFGGDVLGQIMSDPTHVDPDQFAQAYSRIMSALFIGVMIGVPVA